jgi:hypothetical protein
MYIRISISAQSAASTPPAPDRMLTSFHRLDVLAQLLEFGVGLCHIVGPAFVGRQFIHHREVIEALTELLDPPQFALGVGKLTGDALGVRLVIPEVRVRRLVLQLFDSTAKPLDIKYPLHRGQGGVEGGNIGLTIGIHGSSRYRRQHAPLASEQ